MRTSTFRSVATGTACFGWLALAACAGVACGGTGRDLMRCIIGDPGAPGPTP